LSFGPWHPNFDQFHDFSLVKSSYCTFVGEIPLALKEIWINSYEIPISVGILFHFCAVNGCCHCISGQQPALEQLDRSLLIEIMRGGARGWMGGVKWDHLPKKIEIFMGYS
jgi:hypothetical protein